MSWKKSSKCESSHCVEIEDGFHKSSFCESAHCVEVAFASSTQCADACVNVATCVEVGKPDDTCDMIHVRDSKDPTGPVLNFTRDEWKAFLLGAKAGEFDV